MNYHHTSKEVHLKIDPDMYCSEVKKEDAISILKTCIFFYRKVTDIHLIWRIRRYN
jgi:hypothetical protein